MSDSSSEEENVIKEEKVKEDDSGSSCNDEEQEKASGLEEETLVAEQNQKDTMVSLQPLPRRKRFVPNYEVEGVTKVILSDDTQILIDLVIGTNVTSQNPWVFVNKAKILECIDLYGDEFEFFPLKQQLEAYEDDAVLIGYIPDESKDVDEFYVCYTTKSRDHCKDQSDRFIKRQQKKLDKAVQKKPRPWKTLGSEVEIIQLKPINTRPLVELEIRTKFPTVYQPDKFRVRDTNSVRDGYVELTPYRTKYNNIFRRRVDNATQAAPAQVNNVAQTELRYPKNMWTQSITDSLANIQEDVEAGGDTVKENKDKNLDSSEDEEENINIAQDLEDPGIVSYKATLKRMRRPSFIKNINNFMATHEKEMHNVIELNTVMDMYHNDYKNLSVQKINNKYTSMEFEEYICFTDVRSKFKYVTSAVFHPMWTGIVAISYTDGSPSVMKGVTNRPDPVKRAVYGINPVMIWSHTDSLLPKLFLESPSEVKTLSFCPFDQNILVGGCINGQIIIWDITNKLENVETIEILSETREKYRIAMNAHMDWMKNVQDKAVVQYSAMSNILHSHYGYVTSIKWLSPNFAITPTGKQVISSRTQMFFTGSADGTILIWNLSVENVAFTEAKKLKKSKRVLHRPSGLLVDISPLKVLDRCLQPCFKIILGRSGQPQMLPLQSFSINKPIIKYTHIPQNSGTGRKYFSCEVLPQTDEDVTKVVYCGSLHGELMRISWDGHEFNTGELINSQYCDIQFSVYIHDGIITTCSRNPFIANITLTVGGKIFAIWSNSLLSRPLLWKKRPHRLTGAVWSNYKPSVIFISTSDGSLETWDLLLRSDKPIAIQTVSGTMLTGVSLHSLPLSQNIIGIADANGSFKMMLIPPIFMEENINYKERMEAMINRELIVTKSFVKWQEEWTKNNPSIILEIRRKEVALLAEKEDQKRKEREEEEKRLDEEAEAKRLEKMRVIGPEEKWQQIIQKLIERTIAVKKRINRAELIEQERPLRELEAQRLEKERRMLEIMKNQKTIFNDTVAILFPEAIKKKEKEKESLLTNNKEKLKIEYMEDYHSYVMTAWKTVKENPYRADFSWKGTLSEGKERRQSLHANEYYMRLHKCRLDEERIESLVPTVSVPNSFHQLLHQDSISSKESIKEEILLIS